MYSKDKKIICYIGDRRFNFIVPDTSSINIKTIKIFDNSVVMSIDDIVPIRVDIYPVDADNILPVFEIDNNAIADIKMGTIVPKNIGNCIITVKSPDGKKTIGSIPLEVTETPSEIIISDSETYNVILTNHNISNDGITETADNFNSMLVWAKEQGYKKVVMPNGTYLIGSKKYITLPSDLVLDLGGSILQQESSTGQEIKLINIPSGTHNCRLTNGTIRGDRDNRDSSDCQEFIHGIVCNGDHIELDNLIVEKFLGYGFAIGYGDRKAMAYISKDNLNEISTNNWTTINYINISSFTNNLMIGNPFGYGGWGSIDDTANFNIRFYDSSKTLIKEVFTVRPYREINIPNGAKYVMLDLNDSKVGNGNTDFGNSISYLLEYVPSDYLNIHDCTIQYCKSLGVAYSGQGTHNVIDNCNFNNNGGANATADIDLEDGWENMRCLVIKNCTFDETSTRSYIQCAGESIVLYNNVFSKEVGISNRCYHTRIIDNTFSTTSGKALRVVTEWFSGGCFLEGNTFTNFNCVFNNDRNKEKAVRLYFKNNTFNGGVLFNESRYQVIKGLTVSSTTSLNGKFEDITIN